MQNNFETIIPEIKDVKNNRNINFNHLIQYCIENEKEILNIGLEGINVI